MQDKINNDIYTLDDLLNNLESIRLVGEGELNFANAFYCLALEIKTIREAMKIPPGYVWNISKIKPESSEDVSV